MSRSSGRSKTTPKRTSAKSEMKRGMYRQLPPQFMIVDGRQVLSKETSSFLNQLNPRDRRKYLDKIKPRKRKIDDSRFQEVARSTSKRDVSDYAENIRATRGVKARVISNNDGTYSVYMGGADKRGRRYNYHTAGHEGRLGLMERVALEEAGLSPAKIRAEDVMPTKTKKKKGFWNRLFGRSETVVAIDELSSKTRSQELDEQEVEDFQRLRDEAIRNGKTRDQATVAATRGAKILRERKEKVDALEERQKQLEKQVRKAKQEEAVAAYYQAVKEYEEPVPIGTIAQYNSLEIGGATTMATAGGVLAATTTIAAWPAIPLFALGGWLGAKAIRNNVGGIGLKQGVNNVLDTVEGQTESTIQALRVSKDNEEYPSKGLIIRRPKKPKPKKPKVLKDREAKAKKKKKRKRGK